MQNLRGNRGFSLLELMIVVAIIAVMSALAAPMIGGMRLKESARGNAQHLAGILADARAQAITQGTNVMVIFSNPVSFQTLGVGAPPAVAQVIQDLDANWVINAGTDVVMNVFGAQDTPQGITPYGTGLASPWPATPLPVEDVGAGATPDLNALANGTTFPLNGGVPAIGFTPRGIPVAIATPNTPGSGAGAYYVTDNNNAVYAVVLLPLGGIRVRALDGSRGMWL